MIVPDVDVAEVRRVKMAVTQRLLGDTIAIAESDWRAPTGLPGWTRAHLATHLARNAEGMRDYVQQRDPDAPLAPDDTLRELEEGSRRSPLEIQIDLDTSAGLLNEAFNQVPGDDWGTALGGPFSSLTLEDLPLMRLNEVVLHHVDLDCGFGFVDIDPQVAEWLVAWNVHRRADLATGPGFRVVSASGHLYRLGTGPGDAEVSGSDANLLGWLTGRLPRTAVTGAEHVSIGGLR